MVPIAHFRRQNSDCPRAGARGGGNLYFRGWSGESRRIRMVYRRTCKRSFSEREGTVLERARLPDDKALAILNHPREGCGTRATGRLVEVDKDTVTLVGFGTFEKRHRGARTGKNPQTGEPVKIKASNTVAFKPGKNLRDSVNTPVKPAKKGK